MTATEPRTADLLDPAWWVDLDRVHEFFTWARREQPVYRDEANGLWAVTRHADLMDVERRSDVFSSRGSYRANIGMDESNMIALDDPEHLAQRRLVSRRFTPRAVQQEAPFLQSRIDELLATIESRAEGAAATPPAADPPDSAARRPADLRRQERSDARSRHVNLPDSAARRPADLRRQERSDARSRHVEVVHDLAGQLPARLTAELLGFPEVDWEDIKSWSERLMRTDSITRDQDALMGVMDAIMEFNPRLEAISTERKECPAHDLISTWTAAGMDPLTMMHETGLFIAGGAETTRTAIGRGLAILAEHPDQWEAAAADPDLVPGLVEEVIRWVTPLNNMFRRVLTDDRIGDQPVQAGDRVMLAYPSANRDEAVFDEPFRFDIRRDPNPHLAFGQGTHFCVGANLARLELRMLFGALTQRWTNLRVITPPDIEPNIFAGAVRRFDLAFDLR